MYRQVLEGKGIHPIEVRIAAVHGCRDSRRSHRRCSMLQPRGAACGP
jgi:hypothetical protein